MRRNYSSHLAFLRYPIHNQISAAAAAFFSVCESSLIEVPAQHSTECMHRCLSTSANYSEGAGAGVGAMLYSICSYCCRIPEQSSEINISPSSDHRARQSMRMKGTAHDIAIDNNQTSGSHNSCFNSHDEGEMIIGASITKGLFPASGHRKIQNAGRNNHPNQKIDPSILKHLKNFLHHRPSLDERSVKKDPMT